MDQIKSMGIISKKAKSTANPGIKLRFTNVASGEGLKKEFQINEYIDNDLMTLPKTLEGTDAEVKP